ncbi:hypothetical protein [Kiloniella laminariae]|uniref:hypothetical protein n=1 Tax=Kiloniella laminariae TaxID=454162 RepID=UPI00036FA431|nr:hypothetical protein [Kiloniella laminariae]
MTTLGHQQIIARTNLRPQDRFKNPKGYSLAVENDVYYCSFKIDAPKKSGIYQILINDQIVYVGRAKCLKNRLSQQYGNVSPRHPFNGGQIQKCRTNAKINVAICQGDNVSFEWKVCIDYVEQEKRLLEDVSNRPPWNKRS